jgi:hypothetical protein
MLNQTSEQPSGDSGAPSLDSRIDNIFTGRPAPQAKPQSPQQSPQEPEQETVETEAVADQTEETQEQTPEETFELELEGDKYVLPKKLEKAVLQERDYTQKSQSLADQRRLVELKEQQFRTRELQQTFHTDVANEVQQMQMIDAVLDQPINIQGMSIEQALQHTTELKNLEKQREQLRQLVTQKHQAWQAQQQTAQAELQRKTIEVLRSRIPTWSDAVANEVTAHFRERGLTDADFQAMNQNPVYIEAAYKAMQFDKLQAKATKTVEQAKTVKTTSARPMPTQVKEHLAYRKALAKAPEGSPERKRVVDAKVASIFSR